MPTGYEIDDTDCNAFLKQRRTLGDKSIPTFGTIFVRGADDLKRRNEPPTPFGIVNADFVFIKIRQLRCDGEARCRGCPRGGCYASVRFTSAARSGNIVHLK